MAGDIARKAMSFSNLNPNIGSWSMVRSMPSSKHFRMDLARVA